MQHLTPRQAEDFLNTHRDAVLLDVRFIEELVATGTPARALHLPFESITGESNPHFVHSLVAQVPRTKPVLLICRSGKRTLDAAQVLESLGYKQVINVLHGVEGDPDASGVRGRINGWLADGLPVRAVAAKAAQMVAASVT